jgi:ABC-type transport system involved in cytochrome bd biosynthesis fused ATPase/permease subunit
MHTHSQHSLTHTGIVMQNPLLFATTIEENIRYGNPSATDEQVCVWVCETEKVFIICCLFILMV